MKPIPMLLTIGLLSAFSIPASAHHASDEAPCYLVFWKGKAVKAGATVDSNAAQQPWQLGFVSKFPIVGEGLSISLP